MGREGSWSVLRVVLNSGAGLQEWRGSTGVCVVSSE